MYSTAPKGWITPSNLTENSSEFGDTLRVEESPKGVACRGARGTQVLIQPEERTF